MAHVIVAMRNSSTIGALIAGVDTERLWITVCGISMHQTREEAAEKECGIYHGRCTIPGEIPTQ